MHVQSELQARYARLRELLAAMPGEPGGLLAFSRVNIYYLAATMGTGVFWLPLEGEPLLMVRKGAERVHIDNPHLNVRVYRSYSELATIAADMGVPFSPVIAAEQGSLPWNLADNLRKRLPGIRFTAADAALARARAVKSQAEIASMRAAGQAQALCMEHLLPEKIAPGMTEMEVARILSDLFYANGGTGITRMDSYGEELLLGSVSAGDNGNFPTFYNGPLGGVGIHPSMPLLGSEERAWQENELLTIDAGFSKAGYCTDKTLCYFSGAKHSLPTEAQKAHDLCRAIEEETAAALKPGAVPCELYKASLEKAAQAGFAEGFMGHGANKVPFLGHSIGLCIDEWPVLAGRFDSPLQAGMTIAIEPKVGLPGFGMVGTENTWLITENGGECLTGGVRDIICLG